MASLLGYFSRVEQLYFLLAELIPAGYSPHLGYIVTHPPGIEAVNIGAGYPDSLFHGVPGDLITAVAQDGGVNLGLVVQLLQVVILINMVEQSALLPGLPVYRDLSQ